MRYLTIVAFAFLLGPTPAHSTPPTTPLIAIIGDSIANGAQVELQNVLGYRVITFSAANGRTMTVPASSDSAAGKVALAAANHPVWIVIELGVNDYLRTEDQARLDAEQLLSEAKVSPWPCILWVLPAADPVKAPTQSAGAAHVRAGILTALTDEPCAVTVEASGLATVADGIHPTPTAKQALARLIDSVTRP